MREHTLAETPISCSLQSQDLEARLEEWRRVLAAVTDTTGRDVIESTIALHFDADTAVGELATLCASEVACCPFFTFDLRITATGVTLEVTVPGGAEPTLQQFARLLPAGPDR
jgi:hypothetical protein